MVTLESLYNDVKTLMKQFFYDKDEIDENYPYYEYIVGTQTSSTGSWTGVSEKITNLRTGTVIYYKLPYAGNGNATLNLTLADGSTTGAKEVWFWNGQRLTTHYGVNSVIGLIYNGTQWWVINPSNNNNNYYLTNGTYILTGEYINSTSLIGCKKSDGKYYKLASLAGEVLDISHPVYLASGNINSGTNSNAVNLVHPWINIASTKSGFTGTAYQDVYIEGTGYNDGGFTLSSNIVTQILTSGRYYMLVGRAYNTTGMSVNLTTQEVFYYNGSELIPANNVKFTRDLSSGTKIGTLSIDGTSTDIYCEKNTNTTYSPATSIANGLMSSTDKTNLDKTVNRYNGNFISGVETVNKPYLRLFHIQSSESGFSSSHLIFEIIGNNNDRLYAKIRVDMRQNDVNQANSNSTYTITPLEVYGFDLNQLYFGFLDNHTNKKTSLDIFRKVGSWTNFYIRIYDDHLRNGSYQMFTPVANGTESYTTLAEAATTLYNASYTSTSQGGTYAEVTNTVPYTNMNANKFVKRGGTSSQFLKADGSVDGNTYVQTGDSRLSNTRTPTDNTVSTAKIQDSAVTLAKLNNNVIIPEYIEGTHGTTATSTWTGTSNRLTSLNTGQVIYYQMTSAGTSTAVTLNLTFADGSTTGAKNVRYNAATNLTTHFPQNTVLCLVYNGTYWITTEIQNTNNYDRMVSVEQVIAGENLGKSKLIGGKSDGKYYLIKSAVELDINYPVLWTAFGSLNKDSNSNNVYRAYAGVNVTDTVSGKTVVVGEQVYLEGTLNGNVFTVSSNVIVSHSGLTNGKYYIILGMGYSSTNIRFNSFDNTVYHYTTSNGLVPVGYSYNDLLDKPTIPTNTNQLTNGAGFTTATGHNHDSRYLKQTGFSTQEMVITYDDDTTETVKFVTYTSGGSL